MGNKTTTACLNGCGFARKHVHGCSLRDRISFLGIAVCLMIILSGYVCAVESAVDRSNIGEITAFSGKVEIIHSSSSINEGMQVGGKIYPKDTIKTETGNVEAVFGINSRIKVASNSELVIESVTQNSEIKSGQMLSKSVYKLILKKGVVRIRVRENLITSTILSIIAGEVKADAPRTDMIISLDKKRNTDSYVGIITAWGRVRVNKRNVNDDEWNPNNEKLVTAGFSTLIEGNDIADTEIKWEKMDITEARDAVLELPFSVDQQTGGFEDIPERIPELQGA